MGKQSCHCQKHGKQGEIVSAPCAVWTCTGVNCDFVSFDPVQKCTTPGCKGTIEKGRRVLSRCVCEDCRKEAD
jgi:hypothetical protein